MYRKLFLVFFITFFICAKAFSATFIVTSNADSGHGTLREALTLASANGSAEKDYIIFNLPDLSIEGRTIALAALLPGVSSNLDIDGSTQPGNKFGVSDAKIIITQPYVPNFTALDYYLSIASASDIGIYGLQLENHQPTGNYQYLSTIGIAITSSQNIIIGAPGKGNVFKGFNADIDTQGGVTHNVDNLKISSNFLSVNEDGITAEISYEPFILYDVKNIILGGDTPEEGNVISGIGFLSLTDYANSGAQSNPGFVKIENNFVGVNHNGQDTLLNNGKSSVSSISINGTSSQTTNIKSNTVFGGFVLGGNAPFSIKSNKFGISSSGAKIFPTAAAPITLAYCTKGGIIGGTDPADQNIFAGMELPPSYFPVDLEGVISNIDSPGVEVIGNYFKCNSGVMSNNLSNINVAAPVILGRTTTGINGTAAPNSRIDLYYSVECNYCEPQILFTSVITDASGHWSYNGTLQDHAVIAAATLNGSTSEFTRLSFTQQPADIKIKPACNGQKGSITGLKTNGALTYTWYNDNGTPVAYTLNLDAAPGKYHLVISNNYCETSSSTYEIDNISSVINDSQKHIKQPSCSDANGEITGLQIPDGETYAWKDQNGNLKGNTLDVFNLPPGSYTLHATISGVECEITYGPVLLTNQNGPNVDQSNIKIQSTKCGQATGSITNMDVHGDGSLTYVWTNAQQQQVGYDKDLINQPAGVYTLTVTDDTQCAPIHSTPITINEINGISLDESKVKLVPAGCDNNKGTITGIAAPGATIYQWTDANNNLVGSLLDLEAPVGDYKLTVSNSSCDKTSQVYHISQQAPVSFPAYNAIYEKACFGMQNGTVTIVDDGQPKAYHWVNATTLQDAGTTSTLTGGPGIYKLYLTDVNGCENYYSPYLINEAPDFTVANRGQTSPEQCGNGNGAISETTVAGGIPPYTYSWTDASGSSLGSQSSLSNLKAGTYTLTIEDSRHCKTIPLSFTIDATATAIAAPSVSDIQLCSSGNALIMVNNASATTVYRLYDSESSITPAAESTGGKFTVSVADNRSFYITQLNGTCESSRAEVKASVGLSAVDINNTFTPNGDGINDYWNIKSIQNYPNALVQVFTRYGQKVFESRGYSAPFDGTLKGQKLPAGVYYYIINLNSNCNILSGSLTLVR